ncbi:hypothetical protein COV05_02985 [Candidatus Uhrbacteria bacterium CG10_big_fil_rev_8_21_14_0_10_48_16]|uniref:EF-hand domain-containing protein n=1 Tax=Candidatus Uhrbacteria bacterium CG10_big_fil_rev_8_21_14_0_10_48_16 TaxID=1975038 RepID=A0A2M8LH25_9BACT|nr:MAG: hypothetical protein COV05_02985 [Candidatus Uhrbacteria bacterium CG10_big_fil_rev_8_21_14_0_10_48_16]
MAQENLQQIEKPQSAQSAPSGVEARVFTMPERYRHGAQAVLHQPETKQTVKSPIEVRTPGVPVAPPKAPPKPLPTKRKGSSTKKIVIIGVIVLLLLSIGGFFLLRTVPDATETTDVTPTTTTRPAPTTTEPVEEPVEEPVTEPVEEPDVFPVEVTPGVDSDSDGLTDTEEKLVYGTDSRLPDTDADGFLDGNEVFHRYNPASLGTLLESGLVEAMTHATTRVSYEFYYPKIWDIQEEEGELVMDAQTGEGFRVTFVEKEEAQTLEDWADEQLTLTRPLVGTTKNGLQMIQGEDQLSAYIDLGSGVLLFKYDTGIKTRVDYLQTFQMMINSVQVVESEEVEVIEEPVVEEGV